MRLAQISLAALSLLSSVRGQTSTTCDPLEETCSSDTALGTSISIDFTQGAVDSFEASGSPTYGDDGVSFTISESGDAPQLTSLFYIMFGRVEITMKAAPGAGIVSCLVLESDDLDEIDMEWLGADSTQVQTNYFGKGNVTSYNRGEWDPAADNQDEWITYTVQWTESEIVWWVGEDVIRVLTPDTADANQYPQTPMRVIIGAWSGGDSSNAAGTISWARGPTDYSDGPFTMTVKSLAITDFSTGSSYSYGDTSGDWESIESDGGEINANADDASSVGALTATATGSAVTGIPAGIGSHTGWPWVATPTSSTATTTYTVNGVPSGWHVSSNGKIVPDLAPAVGVPYLNVVLALSLSLGAALFYPVFWH